MTSVFHASSTPSSIFSVSTTYRTMPNGKSVSAALDVSASPRAL